LRCEVFSNLTADDIRADGRRRGLVTFQQYLRFAKTGVLNVATPTGEQPESPFEEEVIEALRSAGYDADPQVGSEGYRIDLAIRDPEAPGRYIIGVECDGATYHSARSARDRDKLRQRVLEARGWRLHRIWSSDWWHDRDAELARAIRAIEAARQSPAGQDGSERTAAGAREADAPGNACDGEALAPTAKGAIYSAASVSELPPSAVSKADARPYIVAPAFAGSPSHSLSIGTMAEYAGEVVRDESPIHHALLLHRLRLAAGYGRAGKHVQAWLAQIVTVAERDGRIRRWGDAWIAPDCVPAKPRDWSECPAAIRKVEYLPKLEIAAALRQIIGNAFGVGRDEAAREALKLLGFRRVTKNGLDRSLGVLGGMMNDGSVVERDASLWLQGENAALPATAE